MNTVLLTQNDLKTPNRPRLARWLNPAWAALSAAILLGSAVRGEDAPLPPPGQPKKFDGPLYGAGKLPKNTGLNYTIRGSDDVFYCLKFDGGTVDQFCSLWKQFFPDDTFVVTAAAREQKIPSFEIVNVRLAELARSIAFLSEGTLTIEVVEKDKANLMNIWRIGGAPAAAGAARLKMRAVSAPNIFALQGRLKHVVDDATKMEGRRLMNIEEQIGPLGGGMRATTIEPLSTQKVLVLIGDEDGLAGMESFIKACEESAAQDAKGQQLRREDEEKRQTEEETKPKKREQ